MTSSERRYREPLGVLAKPFRAIIEDSGGKYEKDGGSLKMPEVGL